jgi:hypothetical protein
VEKLNETLDSGFTFIKKFCEKCMEIKKKKYNYQSKFSFELPTFAISMHFFHYYSYHMSFRKFDRYELATACVFLASKLCNDFIKVETALEIYTSIKNVNQSQAKGDKKPDLTKYEIELMSIIGFDLDFDLPYNYLDQYLNQIIKEEEKRKKAQNLSFVIVNDSYRRPLCLLFPPKYIALAAIYGASTMLDADKNFIFDEIIEFDKEIDKDILLFCISELDNCTNTSN